MWRDFRRVLVSDKLYFHSSLLVDTQKGWVSFRLIQYTIYKYSKNGIYHSFEGKGDFIFSAILQYNKCFKSWNILKILEKNKK